VGFAALVGAALALALTSGPGAGFRVLNVLESVNSIESSRGGNALQVVLQFQIENLAQEPRTADCQVTLRGFAPKELRLGPIAPKGRKSATVTLTDQGITTSQSPTPSIRCA